MSYRFLIDLRSDFLSDFLFVFPIYLLHDSEESQNIVQVGYHQQQDENTETYILGTFHELIAWLATSNHLVKEEEHMTTIQCRNRQDVHKRQNNAQECGHHPESMPIPHRREQAAQSSETAQTLGSFLGEHILHITYVASQDVPAILDTGRETLEETITDMGYLVIEHYRMIVEAKLHILLICQQQDIVFQGIARSLHILNAGC